MEQEKRTEVNTTTVLSPLTEQERTTLAKRAFLKAFVYNRGVVSHACQEAQIGRTIFYEWRKTDPQFAAALEEVTSRTNEEAEDILKGLVFLEKDPPSVRYYLDRKHPGYQPKAKIEHKITGNRTFEDIVREAAIRRAQLANGINPREVRSDGGGDTEALPEQGGDNSDATDTQQEG